MRRSLRFLLFVLLYLAYFVIVTTGQTLISKPSLKFTASPMTGLSPFNVRLRAEIVGDITEEWRCPEVVWTMQEGTVDETKASTMEMCHADIDPPRVWTEINRINTESDETVDLTFRVMLLHGKKVIANKVVTVRAVGGGRPREWDR